MDEKKFKYVQWLLYGLLGISVLFIVLFYINPVNPNLILYWMYALIVLSIAIALTVVVVKMVKNPKGSAKILVIIGIMVLLGIISFALSKNTLTPDKLEKYSITVKGVKMVGAGLLMTYCIMAVAVGVLIYTSLIKYFKK